MQAVILAGGKGLRLSEESDLKPKPLIQIGSRPILWHLMKNLHNQGICEFILCVGHKGDMIKKYFYDSIVLDEDFTISTGKQNLELHSKRSESWKVTIIDTGENTMTGGRLKRVSNFLDGKDFLFTYADGLSNINLENLTKFHFNSKRLATVTAIKQPTRYGILNIENDNVLEFSEKVENSDTWINGGYFVLNPKVLNFIEKDDTMWEHEPIQHLIKINQLSAYKHTGFWLGMDTIRDRRFLENLWSLNEAPWKNW